MLGAEAGVEGGAFQVFGDLRIAGEAEHVDAESSPSDGAAGFDGAGGVRIAGGLFAGGKAAGVVNVTPGDAAPMMFEGVAIFLFAGDAVEFEQALQVVK